MEKIMYCDPELQYQIEEILSGKMEFDEKEYLAILREIWKTFKFNCKDITKMCKHRDKAVKELMSW